MLVLPSVLPGQPSRLLETTADAVALTLVVAPILWRSVVRPLREIIHLRSRFLADLFVHIEADRRRVARELHDGVGQSLTLLVSGLRSAHQAVTDPETANRCRHLQELAQQALADVKQLALGLRPSLLDDLGLAPALQRVAADVREHHPTQIDLKVASIVGERLPEGVETVVFRIVQEALANVVKHARAAHAEVVVARRGKDLTVRVADDGCGVPWESLNKRNPGHLGLTGMRERARLLGGELVIESAPGRGTTVTATVPIKG